MKTFPFELYDFPSFHTNVPTEHFWKPILAQCSIYIPLKTSENQRSFDFFTGIAIENWAKMG